MSENKKLTEYTETTAYPIFTHQVMQCKVAEADIQDICDRAWEKFNSSNKKESNGNSEEG